MNRYEAKGYVNTVQRLLRIRAEGHANNAADEEELNAIGITCTRSERQEEGWEQPLLTYDVLTQDQVDVLEAELVKIEKDAVMSLFGDASQFRIITKDPSGPSSNEHLPQYNRLEKVVRIEAIEKSKLHEWPDGDLQKFGYTEYIAHGGTYKGNKGQDTHDWTHSAPEGYVRTEGGVQQYGAASALLARLLEAYAAGGA